VSSTANHNPPRLAVGRLDFELVLVRVAAASVSPQRGRVIRDLADRRQQLQPFVARQPTPVVRVARDRSRPVLKQLHAGANRQAWCSYQATAPREPEGSHEDIVPQPKSRGRLSLTPCTDEATAPAAPRNDHTFAHLAESQGRSAGDFVQALLAVRHQLLAKSVADSRLTQERADWMITQMTLHIEEGVSSKWSPRGWVF
jgi:hypothetical protein